MFGNPLNSLDPTQRVECGRPTVMIVRGDKRVDMVNLGESRFYTRKEQTCGLSAGQLY